MYLDNRGNSILNKSIFFNSGYLLHILYLNATHTQFMLNLYSLHTQRILYSSTHTQLRHNL